jgi:hypothetical protein
MEDQKVNIDTLRSMFKGLIEDPTILDIDKEIEELKIPEDNIEI